MSEKKIRNEYPSKFIESFIEAVDRGEFTTPRGTTGHASMKAQKWCEERGYKVAKSVRCYWYDHERQMMLSRLRNAKNYKTINGLLAKKIDKFLNKTTKPIKLVKPLIDSVDAKRRPNNYLERSITDRIRQFSVRHTGERRSMENARFNAQEFKEYMAEKQDWDEETQTVVCALSGKRFNYLEEAWQLDHINPRGGNDLTNCAVTLSIFNQMKTSMEKVEFIDACKLVIAYDEETKNDSI